MIPLGYDRLLKYLLDRVAKELAARLHVPIGTSRAPPPRDAPRAPPLPISDDTFGQSLIPAEPEPSSGEQGPSEEERLNRSAAYAQARLEDEARRSIEEARHPEALAREAERRRVEEARDPETLAREEERRREEFLREEAASRLREQQEQYREQDAEKQKQMFDEAGKEKERQGKEAADRKEEQERQSREQAELARAEQEREERDRAQRERAEDDARERRQEEEERRRESELERVKADVKAFDESLRRREAAELREFQGERRSELLKYGEETGRRIDLFQQQQEARFARERADLGDLQEKRWQACEHRIEAAYRDGHPVDAPSLAKEEKGRLRAEELERGMEQQAHAEEEKQRARWDRECLSEEKKRTAEELKAEDVRIGQVAARKQEVTEAVRRADFEHAEAGAWKEEQALRERENRQLQQVQGWARDGINSRFAGEPEKLQEMQERQEKVLAQQKKEQEEAQQKRWDETQRKLAEEHRMRLESETERVRQEAERLRQEAERRRQEALDRAATPRQTML